MKTFSEWAAEKEQNESVQTPGIAAVEAPINTVERYRKAAYVQVDAKTWKHIIEQENLEEMVAGEDEFLNAFKNAYQDSDYVFMSNLETPESVFLKSNKDPE